MQSCLDCFRERLKFIISPEESTLARISKIFVHKPFPEKLKTKKQVKTEN
jgi:hypothetical protein